MGSTWQSLLDQFARIRNHEFRDDPDRQEALLDQMADTIQRMLEKLRDEHGEA